MPVPYTFANKSGAIPLSELDANFATIPVYADTAGTVTNSAQGNITSVGTLTSLSVNGPANMVYASLSGNVVANYFIGNGYTLTNLNAANLVNAYGNSNVLLLGQSGWAGNIIPVGNSVYSLGNVTNQWKDLWVSNSTIYINGIPLSAVNASGNTSLLFNNAPIVTSGPNAAPITTDIVTSANVIASGFSGNSIVANTANIGNVGISSNNITVPGFVSAFGNVLGNNGIFSNTVYGFAAVVGNVGISSNNVSVPGYVSAFGNVFGAFLHGDGSNISNVNVTGTYGNANVEVLLASGTVTTDILTTGNVSAAGNVTGAHFIGNVTGSAVTVTANAQPNITSVGILTSTTINGNIVVTGNANVQGNLTYNNVTNLFTDNLVLGLGNNQSGINVTNAGIVVGNTAQASFLYSYTAGNVWQSNIDISAVGNILSGKNMSATGNISSAANITGGNLLTSGLVSATGNITAPFFIGNVIGNISGNLTVTGANTNVLFNNNGIVGATSGLTFNTTGNILSSTGNIVSAANISGGNLLTAGLVSSTGNVYGNVYVGNGAGLTSLVGANVTGTVAQAAVANALNPTNSYTIAGLQSNGTIVGTSPNSGTTGGVKIADFPGDPNAAYLQATNHAQTVQYGFLYFNSNKTVTIGTNTLTTSLGVGTNPSGVTGEIRATDNVTGYYASDIKFKENIQEIDNALDIVKAIGSKTFSWSDNYISEHGGEDGYFIQKDDFGVIAQDVQSVFPRAVRTRPDGSLAVDYEKLSTLAFGAISTLLARIEALENKK